MPAVEWGFQVTSPPSSRDLGDWASSTVGLSPVDWDISGRAVVQRKEEHEGREGEGGKVRMEVEAKSRRERQKEGRVRRNLEERFWDPRRKGALRVQKGGEG